MSDRNMVRRAWEKWALPFISTGGNKPLTGAALINVSFDRPSRSYSSIVEQEGLAFKPSDVRPIVEGLRDNCLHADYFYVGAEKYLVTTILENLYCARSLNSKNSGVIVCRQAPYVLVATYQGDALAAMSAMPVIDDLLDELSQEV